MTILLASSLLLIKATVILGVGLLGVGLANRARASVRHAILVAMFAGLGVFPFAAAMLPVVEFPILPHGATQPINQDLSRAVAAAPSAETYASSAGASPARTGDQVISGLPVTIESLILAVWIVGVCLVLLALSIGVYRVQRLRRDALPCLDTQRQLAALARAAGVGQAIDVVVHEEITGPIACGVVRPAIVLPPEATTWDKAALTRALVHELEHVRRRDWAVQLLARAVCAVYWFHPLVWIGYRQLCLQAEHACDDAVVAREEDTIYADQLVTLARRMAARPAVAVLGMANRSDLAARVAAVLDPSRKRGRAGAIRTGAIAATALGLLLTLAPLQLVASSLEPSTDAAGANAAAAQIPGDGGASALRLRAAAATTALSDLRARLLVEAADEGDLRGVRELLDDGANVNAAVAGDGSPLIAAARGGHREIVQLLLDRGAEVNLGVPGDGAPLIMAAREGYLSIVQSLLDHGADIDLIIPGDENALIQASGSGQLAMVNLLAARGANVNARVWADRGPGRPDGEWRTPLSMALRGGHHDVASFLRTSGAIE